MQAFAVERERVTIPPEHAAFPKRCLGCGGKATTRARLRRYHGLDLLGIAFQRWVALDVPVCGSCALRKRAAFALAFAPFAFSLARLIAVSNAIDGNSHSPPGSPFDLWLKATFATGVIAYYGARRFSEAMGLGVRLTAMSSGGGLVTLRCKSTRDALEIAELSREAAGEPPRPATAQPAPLASARAGAPAVTRYRRSPRKSVRAFLTLVAMIAALELLGRVLGMDARPLEVLVGAGAAVCLPLVFSRKIMLTLTTQGFQYAPWGSKLVRWSEVEWATLLDARPLLPGVPAFPLIEVQPKHPEAFASGLSWSGRLASGAALARPRFAIDLGNLDAEAGEIMGHFRRNVGGRA